jgi:hypothetical protein
MIRYASLIFIITILVGNLQAQNKTRTINTDSSIIKITLYNSLGKITEEIFNKKDLIHTTWYYPEDSTAIEYDFYTDKATHPVGIYKSYSKTGKLKLYINEDKNIWLLPDTLLYPNYFLLCSMKLKGDSMLKSFYGEEFFNEHIKWDIGSSYYFDSNYSEPSFSISWTSDDAKDRYKATEFNIRYNLNYDNEVYKDVIQIILNKNGELLPCHSWNEHWMIYNYGLEKLPDNYVHDYLSLTKRKAIELAKNFGLQENNSSTISSRLEWESSKGKEKEIFNGNFRISVTQRYMHLDSIQANIWTFNPWTKEFIERKDTTYKVEFTRIFGSSR